MPRTSGTSGAAGPSAGRRFFERWLFWPIALVLVALALELGYRAQRIVSGRPYLDARAAVRVDALADENSKLRLGGRSPQGTSRGGEQETLAHPYLAFVSRENLLQLEQAIVALRTPQRAAVDVLVVGGNGAQTFATTAQDAFVEALGTVPEWKGRRIVFWDFADARAKQPQQLELLLYLTALGAVPDVVVDISGRNEIQLGFSNALSDTHPVYPSRTHWEPLVFGGATDRVSLDLLVTAWESHAEIDELVGRLRAGGIHCALWADGAIERIERLALDRSLAATSYLRRSEATQSQTVLRGPMPPIDTQQSLLACANAWYQSTRDLGALCAARQVRFVSVLEPFGQMAKDVDPQDSESKPGERIEQRLAAGRRTLTQTAKSLAGRGVIFIDAGKLAEEPLTPRETAQALAGAIAEKLGAVR